MKRLFNWLFGKKPKHTEPRPTTTKHVQAEPQTLLQKLFSSEPIVKPKGKLEHYATYPCGIGRTLTIFSVNPSPFPEPMYKAFIKIVDETGERDIEVKNPFIGGWLAEDLTHLIKSAKEQNAVVAN